MNTDVVSIDYLSNCQPGELVRLKTQQETHLILTTRFAEGGPFRPALLLKPDGPEIINATEYQSNVVLRFGTRYSVQLDDNPEYFTDKYSEFHLNGAIILNNINNKNGLFLRARFQDQASGYRYYDFQDVLLKSEPYGIRAAVTSWNICLQNTPEPPKPGPSLFSFQAKIV